MLRINRILVPVDFSEHAEMAVAHAVELTRLHEAQLDLVHVVEDPSFPSFYGAGAAKLYGKVPDLKKRAHDALGTLAGNLAEDVTVETYVVSGQAGPAIIEFVDEHDIDLVVIASRGLSGVQGILVGSVTEKVVRRASCPVFVIKSDTKSLVAEPALEGEE